MKESAQRPKSQVKLHPLKEQEGEGGTDRDRERERERDSERESENDNHGVLNSHASHQVDT